MTKISKSKAIQIIKQSSGRFITIHNIKANGQLRKYSSSIYNDEIHGNLNVLTRDGYRNINPDTIFKLSANKSIYSVA
jgi:hypothetical protein